MLVKWIRCEVVDRDGFDAGQRAWAALRDVPGFAGQRGGWSARGNGVPEAQVFAFWSDRASHEAFMAGPHDVLAAGQAGTYRAADVRMFERHTDVGRPLAAAGGTGALRVAHCTVRAERVEHFVDVQQDVWNPGMSAAPGFLGGVFGRREEFEFLVLTQWESPHAHEVYRTDRFPALRDRAAPATDLTAIAGHVVAIEPAWSVSPLM